MEVERVPEGFMNLTYPCGGYSSARGSDPDAEISVAPSRPSGVYKYCRDISTFTLRDVVNLFSIEKKSQDDAQNRQSQSSRQRGRRPADL